MNYDELIVVLDYMIKNGSQDLRFFNKEGYEIPLAKASNIVIKIYSKKSCFWSCVVLSYICRTFGKLCKDGMK